MSGGKFEYRGLWRKARHLVFGLLLFIYRSCAFHNGFQVLISTRAHIPKLAYVKLWYPAEIAVNFTQIPLQNGKILVRACPGQGNEKYSFPASSPRPRAAASSLTVTSW